MPELSRSFDESQLSTLEVLAACRAGENACRDENARRETGHFIFTNSG
jgi:hypothetical protein